ncbi:MAG: NADH-quinone oxidoreductase subunit D [Holosporales bacterium]|jgi:NADH-quinone oxidoreductase subunit D|nr:NADH-quinone oxidoreductase subunit D [Holosporales bacterium]
MGIDSEEYILNFGPHHPSTHGVLRLILRMKGEVVISCVPDIGYLHRGIEKIVENKKWLSITPFIDRLDYLAPLHMEHAYVLALEAVLEINVPKRAAYIRTIFDELTRIASHIMAIGSAVHNLGMLSLFLYGFEEREKILSIFEMTTGSRMHMNYYVPGGLYDDLSDEIIQEIRKFIRSTNFYMDAVKTMALDNRIFKQRTVGIGLITKEIIRDGGITGPIARASGISRDLRKDSKYGAYSDINFEIITLKEGDCYSRFEIRYMEIKQSLSIIEQCLDKMPGGKIHDHYILRTLSDKILLDNEIKEAVYSYFFEHGIRVPENSMVYRSTEGARGELGVFICTEKKRTKPYRLHVRSPNFAHIQMLEQILIGVDIQDITAILGSLDLIMGDCDR